VLGTVERKKYTPSWEGQKETESEECEEGRNRSISKRTEKEGMKRRKNKGSMTKMNQLQNGRMPGADPNGRVGLQPLSSWDCGFESHRGHGCLSLVSVCVLSGRGLCDGLIARPEESYRVWCVSECDIETSTTRQPRPDLGCCATGKGKTGCQGKRTE
jgi:hypothetical protein